MKHVNVEWHYKYIKINFSQLSAVSPAADVDDCFIYHEKSWYINLPGAPFTNMV